MTKCHLYKNISAQEWLSYIAAKLPRDRPTGHGDGAGQGEADLLGPSQRHRVRSSSHYGHISKYLFEHNNNGTGREETVWEAAANTLMNRYDYMMMR